MVKILLVGKPNVGKSTLVNRLLNKRKSIQSSVSGVTRDYLEYSWVLDGEALTLIDSAGIGGDTNNVVQNRALAMSLAQLGVADIVLFILAADGLSGEDIELATQLRPYKEKTLVVVNKTDLNSYLADAHSLGFEPVIPVSAEHNRGITEFIAQLQQRISGLYSSEEKSPASSQDDLYPADDEELEPTRKEEEPRYDASKPESTSVPGHPSICVVGRPNTGKSSLLNVLAGFDRAIVSDIPGTTRDAVAQQVTLKKNTYTVIDTAGLRRKKKNRDAIEFYSQLRSKSAFAQADCCILLIDALEGITEQDITIAQNLEAEGRAYIVMCNKWDLVSEQEGHAMIEKAKDLHGIFRQAMIFPCSVKTGKGLEKIPHYVHRMLQHANATVTTGTLNEHLARWTRHSPPKSSKKTNVKVRYGTQVGTNPPHFAFFANKYAKELRNYTRYLRTCIRRDFGILYVPIRIDMRIKSKEQQ